MNAPALRTSVALLISGIAKFTVEQATRALQAPRLNGKPGASAFSWHDCVLALAYGEPGALRRVSSETGVYAGHIVSEALGLTMDELHAMLVAYDHDALSADIGSFLAAMESGGRDTLKALLETRSLGVTPKILLAADVYDAIKAQAEEVDGVGAGSFYQGSTPRCAYGLGHAGGVVPTPGVTEGYTFYPNSDLFAVERKLRGEWGFSFHDSDRAVYEINMRLGKTGYDSQDRVPFDAWAAEMGIVRGAA